MPKIIVVRPIFPDVPERLRDAADVVANTPGVVDDATADTAFALMLAAARRIVEGDEFVRHGRWTATSQRPAGLDVHHRTLGIVGFGRIGRAIARRASGFDMKVLYHTRRRLDPAEEARLGVVYADLGTLLASADFVVLQVPDTSETQHLIGAAQLARMKRSAVLAGAEPPDRVVPGANPKA